MSLTHQTSNLTKYSRVRYAMRYLHYSFLFRVMWMVIALAALMAVTIGTYQGTENLIGWVSQWGI